MQKSLLLGAVLFLFSGCTQVVTTPLSIAGSVVGTTIEVTGSAVSTAVDAATSDEEEKE